MFAIVTFRNTGPIKTWGAMRATNVHNARTVPLPHAMPAAPPPRFLIGGADLVRDVKLRLRAISINPDRLRKNGVIAFEAILTASAAFFDVADADRAAHLERWVQAQVEWAMERYGPHRVASMVLHLDEKTPHVHLVILPLEVKQDRRRRDTGVRWSLVGRTISGPGRYDDVQDHYAAAMSPLGLIRGLRGSGRKHEPVPIYLARMAFKEREVDDQRNGLSRERERMIEVQAGIDAQADALAKRQAEHTLAVAAHVARVAADESRLATERATINEERAAIREAKKQALRTTAAAVAQKSAADRALEAAAREGRRLEADLAKIATERQHLIEVEGALSRRAARINAVRGLAKTFMQRLDAVRGQPLTPAAATARDAARALQAQVRATPVPDPTDLAMLAAFAKLRDDARSGQR